MGLQGRERRRRRRIGELIRHWEGLDNNKDLQLELLCFFGAKCCKIELIASGFRIRLAQRAHDHSAFVALMQEQSGFLPTVHV